LTSPGAGINLRAAMCGIAGILTFGGSPVDPSVLGRMGTALRHRGPDAEGTYLDGAAPPAVGFIHRRLSIIDLSRAADQPLGNEDGTVQLMVNGEIYNFQELRRRLASGHTFRSQGDVETVVHLYEELGDEAVAALDGMFALALWDSRRRRLLLARDAFGKKPLYYWHDGARFAFGSEIKALLAAGVPAEMDTACLAEYLTFGYVPTPRTLFRGIRKLPPAATLVVDAAGVHAPRRYWDLRFPPAGESAKVGLDEAAERVGALLASAVRKRLVADVPIGILLSGGVDSSAVAALAARAIPGTVKTFTVGFEGDPFFDERPHAERVARRLGTEHRALVVQPQAAELVETLLEHHDEPFGDSSALPTYLVAREARRHVTVVLNGDGGDETFAGYDRFLAALIAERTPAFARRALRAGALMLPGFVYGSRTLRRARRFAQKAALPFEERIAAWTSFFDRETLAGLDGTGLAERERILSSFHEALSRCPGASLLSRLLYLNVRTYLLDDLLPKMDRMTMAHGLEARSPLLDRDLMEYAATLPDGLKWRGRRGKIVLKKAVEGLLPAETLRRPKHGFGIPLEAWFRGELRPMFEQVVLERPRLGEFLRVDAVRRLLGEHLAGRADRGHQLWTLLTLELWLRRYRLGA
jgi:asparagine synthase (glutamine-hydrolysing)